MVNFNFFAGNTQQDAQVILAIKSLTLQKIQIVNAAGDLNNDITVTDPTGIWFASNLTKQLDANFAEGNNQGMLDTGVKAASTPYALYQIVKNSDGTKDILASATYPTGTPTVPAGWTLGSYFWSIMTDSSSNIVNFRKDGFYCVLTTLAGFDVNDNAMVSNNFKTATSRIPPRCVAFYYVIGLQSAGQTQINVRLRDGDATSTTSNNEENFFNRTSGGTLIDRLGGGQVVSTNASRQIKYAINEPSGTAQVQIIPYAFIFNPDLS